MDNNGKSRHSVWLSDDVWREVDALYMQKQACGIVGGFMEDIFGKELKPWQESEKPGMEP